MAPRSIALFSLAALLSSIAAAEECASAGECAAEMSWDGAGPSTVSLMQKDVKLRDTSATSRAGTAMAAKDKKTLEGDPFQRVWFLCKGAPPQPMTEEMKQAEIEVEDEMMCTAEMTFEGLCCAPWTTGLEYSESVSLGLKSEQVTETSASLAELTTSETEIYKLCTEQSAGEELATMAARLPVTCFEDIFTEADLVGGEVGNETLGPGEAILRTRLGFFLAQGIPMDVIPKCSENVDVCPDGSAPAIVQDSWIQEMSDASLLQKRTKRGSGRDESAPASAGQNVLSLKQTSKKRRRSGRRGGLMTSSGSFTLSSGSNSAGND